MSKGESVLSNDLTQGSERSQLIRMSLPMVWGIFAIMAMNLADSFFVGQLGTDGLAAMGFTFPVVMIISSLAFGVGTGASSLIARAVGSKQHELVQSYTTQSIIIALLMAALMAGIGLLTVDPLFRLLGAPDRLLPLIHEYMDVWYIGAALIVVPMVGNAGIRAAGNSRLPSLVMITVAIVNFILDPIFIFGLFGVPRMELFGAALATMVAYSVSFFIALYVLKVKLDFLKWEACYKAVWIRWKAILRLSIPAAATNLISPLSVAVTTWLVAHYGSEAVAGYSVASRIETFSLIVVMALSASIAPFAGQNWGAGRPDRLKKALNLSYRFAWFWGLGTAVVLWLVGHWLVQGFTNDPAAIKAATHYLYLVPISFGLLGSIMMVSSMSNGIGEPMPSLWFTLARLLVIYLPLAWALSQWFGLDGIYVATLIANTTVGSAAIWWSWNKCTRGNSSEK